MTYRWAQPLSPRVPTAVCTVAGTHEIIHFRSVQSKTNRGAKGGEVLCGGLYRVGNHCCKHSYNRARQAPPAGRTPPATGLFINTRPTWSSKQSLWNLGGFTGLGRGLSVSETSTCLSLSLSTRRDEVRGSTSPCHKDWRLGPSTGQAGQSW